MAMRLIRLIDFDFQPTALDGIPAAPSILKFAPDASPADTQGCAGAPANSAFSHSTFVTREVSNDVTSNITSR